MDRPTIIEVHRVTPQFEHSPIFDRNINKSAVQFFGGRLYVLNFLHNLEIFMKNYFIAILILFNFSAIKVLTLLELYGIQNFSVRKGF